MNVHDHCHPNKSVDNVSFAVSRRLQVVAGVFACVYVASRLIPLDPLHASLQTYVSLVWWAVLLGFFIGGLITYFVPDSFLINFLGKNRKRNLLYAAFAGIAMSACSHGILAVAIALYKKGASVAAVITFLLAAPWANFAMTILMFGLFGWRASLIVLAAIAIALISGGIYQYLGRANLVEESSAESNLSEIRWDRVLNFKMRDALIGVSSAVLSLANMVLWWILIGILIAALLGAYVPQHFFMEYLGPDFRGMSMTLLFATVIEVCSEGSSPIAFEIFDSTGALGNSFVFLMAGVATDYTEIGLIWSSIGRRSAIWLPVITIPQILLAGYIFNIL